MVFLKKNWKKHFDENKLTKILSILLLSGSAHYDLHNLYFYINPSENPFPSILVNEQPVVTIRLKTAFDATRSNEQVSHLLQTTIASRIYKR